MKIIRTLDGVPWEQLTEEEIKDFSKSMQERMFLIAGYQPVHKQKKNTKTSAKSAS